MFGVLALVFSAGAADSWPMAVGRIDHPKAVRLADGAPSHSTVVASDEPVRVAIVGHEGSELPVFCGNDVRFRCYALADAGPLDLCAGPGDAPCLDGRRLEIPAARVRAYRQDEPVPSDCALQLDEAVQAVRKGVDGVLAGGTEVVLRGERAALVAPKLKGACDGWYGSSAQTHNRAWCELKAAEHVALFTRVIGSSDGVKPVLDALISDCCVGDACPRGPYGDPAARPADTDPAEKSAE